MSELKFHKLENVDGVARITLNRPKHNVFNIEMMQELNAELEKLVADTELKCVVIDAEGASWCAGVEVADHKPEMAADMINTFNRIFELLEQLEVPVIASIQGACLGGGMEVAIACDIIVAARSAIFGQPEIKLGFFPPYAAMRLPQLVGPSRDRGLHHRQTLLGRRSADNGNDRLLCGRRSTRGNDRQADQGDHL